jgi:hypothetical protein
MDIVLGNFDDVDIFGLAKHWQRVSNSATGFGCVFPGDKNAPQIQSAAAVRHNKQWPSRLHDEIVWAGLDERIGEHLATVLSDDDNVGSLCLFGDKSCRKVRGGAPFHSRGAVLHRIAKLRFQLGDAAPDRCLTFIKDLLGVLAGREIKRGIEFTCGNSDHAGIEPLR